MKSRGLILSIVAAATIATASDYEVTPVIGYVVKEGNLNLDNEWLVGGEFQFNNVGGPLKPELSLLYSPDTDYDDNVNDTKITRIGFNGVYEYDTSGSIMPFAKVGLGYERLSTRLYENGNDLYADIGGGIKVPLAEDVALKLEALYMLKDPTDNRDSNLAALVGVAFAFGGEATPMPAEEPPADSDGDGVNDDMDECMHTLPGAAVDAKGCALDSDGDGVIDLHDNCPNTPKGAPVDAGGCPLDGDQDGVIDLYDQCPNTPSGAPVDAKGCALDSDGDGVTDQNDRCPDTPSCFKVDTEGCPLTMDLALTYETNSAKIDTISTQKVQEFGSFLLENDGYKVHIIGHTDDRGSADYNWALSLRRAMSVRDMLVEQGVDASRLSTEGRGETDPKADNATAEGRQANRRIEVQLLR
jgi:OOP family OmpA-OmpF porin